MLSCNDIKKIQNLFKQHNYIMTTSELREAKLYYADIEQLLQQGLIDRIRRGYYRLIDNHGESEINIINHLFPDAIFCMETALFYYKYSDRNPIESCN